PPVSRPPPARSYGVLFPLRRTTPKPVLLSLKRGFLPMGVDLEPARSISARGCFNQRHDQVGGYGPSDPLGDFQTTQCPCMVTSPLTSETVAGHSGRNVASVSRLQRKAYLLPTADFMKSAPLTMRGPELT